MDAMGWLAWLIVGGIAGALASAVMHSRLGIIGDIVVGIIGAFIGGFLFNLIGAPGATGFNLWSILVAFIGAVVLIWIVRAVSNAAGPAAPPPV
jgi:uncharacterized membrane protein YeaQ/YmgE (transglycosylase-associated protein family)